LYLYNKEAEFLPHDAFLTGNVEKCVVWALTITTRKTAPENFGRIHTPGRNDICPSSENPLKYAVAICYNWGGADPGV